MSVHFSGNFEGKKGLSVDVRNNNIEGAIKILGRKVKQEGLIREIRARTFFEKPSVIRRREKAEAVSRALKANRRREP